MQRGNKMRWFAIPVAVRAASSDVRPHRRLHGVRVSTAGPASSRSGRASRSARRGRGRLSPCATRTRAEDHPEAGRESDYDFLRRIAAENGWEMIVDHSGPLGGRRLHFLSLLDSLDAQVTLRYGQSLIDFTPRISNVGQIARRDGELLGSIAKLELTVAAGLGLGS